MSHQFKISALAYTLGKVKGFAGSPLLVLENSAVKMLKVAAHSEDPEHVHPQKGITLLQRKDHLNLKLMTRVINKSQHKA